MRSIPYDAAMSANDIPIKGKRIFVTGGAGFLGSTLAGRLVEQNEIVVYDDFRRNSIADKPFVNHKNLTLIKGDILEYPALRDAMRGSNIVIHCAAIAGIDTVIKSPTDTMRVNMVGTAKTLEAAQTLPGLERFLDFSTSEVFGQTAFRSG